MSAGYAESNFRPRSLASARIFRRRSDSRLAGRRPDDNACDCRANASSSYLRTHVTHYGQQGKATFGGVFARSIATVSLHARQPFAIEGRQSVSTAVPPLPPPLLPLRIASAGERERGGKEHFETCFEFRLRRRKTATAATFVQSRQRLEEELGREREVGSNLSRIPGS